MQISSMRGQYKSCFGIKYKLFDSTYKVRAFDTAWFTKDMPKTEIDIVNRLVSIFNKLMKQVEK